jgi:hypothetical protein
MDVFVSYKREDGDFADDLLLRLEKKDLRRGLIPKSMQETNSSFIGQNIVILNYQIRGNSWT